MLFHVKDANAISNAKKDDFEAIYQIEAAINGMERAKEGNMAMKRRVEQFLSYAAVNGEVLKKKYDWERSLDTD